MPQPICRPFERRFRERTLFSRAHHTNRTLHGGGQQRRVDSHTGRNAWMGATEVRDGAEVTPGTELVPSVSMVKRGCRQWNYCHRPALRPQHGAVATRHTIQHRKWHGIGVQFCWLLRAARPFSGSQVRTPQARVGLGGQRDAAARGGKRRRRTSRNLPHRANPARCPSSDVPRNQEMK